MAKHSLTPVTATGQRGFVFLTIGDWGGLSALVGYSFKLDLFDDAVFVFCNRGRDRLKILEWDGDGFWLHFKRLEKGHFPWPRYEDRRTMELRAEELEQMLDGTKLIRKISGQKVSRAVI